MHAYFGALLLCRTFVPLYPLTGLRLLDLQPFKLAPCYPLPSLNPIAQISITGAHLVLSSVSHNQGQI